MFQLSSLSAVEPIVVLRVFLVLRLLQHVSETWISRSNRSWWGDRARQDDAAKTLGISTADMQKTVAYSSDRYNLSRFSAMAEIVAIILFIGYGGLGWVEDVSSAVSKYFGNEGGIVEGLFFMGILMLLSQLLSLPFSIYSTFVIEERYGYNKQTIKSFFSDLSKALTLGIVFGAAILTTILWIMQSMGTTWWIYAWGALTIFSLVTAWIYPSLLAPLFNKFTPLEDGELKREILDLAEKTGFRADGLFVMDASKRSGHANAYFTGIFGKKRIVLFDTLVNSMNTKEVTAVLAHELGHFKLHHVRTGMIRGLILSLIIFAGIGVMLDNKNFYLAFGLTDVSNHGGLVVFSLWFGLIEFYLQPLQTWFSRRNEFAADEFAKKTLGTGENLVSALKKLREKSSIMPIAHPLYSAMYYSHPPMLERIKTLNSST